MTDQTTDYVLLEDAARQARQQEQLRQRLLATEALADYREEAPKRCLKVAQEVLGDYALRGVWEASGGPNDDFTYSAVAEIDGCRFLAAVDLDYDYPRQRFYLLSPCGNMDHPPADRRIQVTSLAQLADALDQISDVLAGDCYACARLENPEQEQLALPPSATERLVEALEAVIEDRIGQRLDGFLSTYLPDRI